MQGDKKPVDGNASQATSATTHHRFLPEEEVTSLRAFLSGDLADGADGKLPGHTYHAPKKDSKWERGRTRRALYYGISVHSNKVTGSPVLPIPELLAAVGQRLVEAGLVDFAPNAVAVEFFESGKWLPPRPECSVLQFPVVYLLIGAEGLVVHPVCGVDVRVRGDGLFEGGDRLRVVPGDLLLIPSTVKHKVALGADDDLRILVAFRHVTSAPRRKQPKLVTKMTPKAKATPLVSSELQDANWNETPEIEREHVHRVYNTIASHWHRTRQLTPDRHTAWPRVEEFLRDLPPHCLVADVGCGNGKYMGAAERQEVVGCDMSASLVQICAERGFEVCVCDNMSVPFRSGVFDAAISIAVLHHFSSDARRRRALTETARLLRPGGRLLVYAWALEQGTESKRRFPEQDVLVPWHHFEPEEEVQGRPTAEHGTRDEARGSTVYQRYCHVYRKGELSALVAAVPGMRVITSYYDTSNWCVVAERVADAENVTPRPRTTRV